jgi:hypothetical protein
MLVADEAQAVAAAKHYLGFFCPASASLACQAPDAQALRDVVPENRLRVYDSRAAIEGLADTDSVLLLRTGFGAGIHTALLRIEGNALGCIANNPLHLGGAIDADDEHGKTVGGAVEVDLSEGEIDKYDSLVTKVEGDVCPCALGDLTSLRVGCDIGTKWEARGSGRLSG